MVRILVLATLLAGCLGEGGAVSVRWRLRDLTTGQPFDPRDIGDANGYCVHTNPTWTVERVRLVRVLDGAMVETLGSFRCSAREATTPFELKPGTFPLTIRTLPEDAGVTPAPQVRTITKGEVVNLDIVEIGVHRMPYAIPDGGVVGLPDGVVSD